MPTFPCPMGVDGTGIVAACGPKVNKFKPGDQVLGLHQRMDEGTFAEFATFEESEVAIRTPGVCPQVAAAMPVACITAFCALLKCLDFKQYSNSCPSSSEQHSIKAVLINGSSGGVGSFAVLLAKHYFKVPVVLATCSKRNDTYVKQLGADVTIDYTAGDVEGSIQQHLQQHAQNVGPASSSAADEAGPQAHCEGTRVSEAAPVAAHHGEAASSSSSSSSREKEEEGGANIGSSSSSKLDLVIDNVGGLDTMAMSCRLLKPGKGTYVSSVPIGNRAKPPAPSSIFSFFLMLGLRSLLHRFLPCFNPTVVFNGAKTDGAMLQHLVNWFDSVPELGCSSPNTCLLRLTEYTLEDGAKALEVVRSGRAVGKIVLRVPSN